jgi:hypothetical protein
LLALNECGNPHGPRSKFGGRLPIGFYMPPPDDLIFFALRLEEVGAPYMITGATAAIMYGHPSKLSAS